MITISDEATAELSRLLAERGGDEGLRLAVRKGGCAGWQYEMKIAGAEAPDHVIEFEGGRLIIAADSVDRLRGCRVTYADSLSDAGFRIENPRAARSCGCGTSFEDAGSDPGEIEECT